MLIASVPLWAEDFLVNGIYYNIIDETNKTVEVTYIGDYYYSYTNEYTGAVAIPSSVTYNSTTYSITSIGDQAFRGCSGLTSISIGNSVTSIGYDAFMGCSGLTSVTIGNSVTTIGSYAFYGCSGLTSISIGNSVTTIGYDAFNGCSGLTEVNITDLSAWCKIDFDYANPLYYAHHLKLNGTEVTNLVIPNDITEIKQSAFENCTGLTSVTIPNSVTSIGYDAFNGCSGLTEITIPNSVTTIGDDAFNGCTGLTEVNISDLSAWSKINFGNSNANPLSYVHYLKLNGTEVTNLVIPNDVTSIGSYAFYGCTGLTSVTIPNSVNSIGEKTFEGCNKIVVVNSHNTTAPIGAPFDDVVKRSAVLNVPSSAIASYQSTDGWKDFANIREMAMNGNYDFEVDGIYYRIISLTDLTAEVVAKDDTYNSYSGEVVIPETVSYRNREFKVISIGAMTFSDCSELTSLTIPQTVTTVGKLALNGCTGLKSLIIADSNTDLVTNGNVDSLKVETLYLGRKASVDFKSLTDLKVITFAGGVTSINKDAFSGCTGLTTVTIGDSVTSIGERAFDDCIGLTEVNISDLSAWCKIDFADYDANPLYYAHHLKLNGTEVTNLVIPNDITEIKQYAFQGCTGLTSVTIGNSVTSIGHRAFVSCSNLTEVNITDLSAWCKIDFECNDSYPNPCYSNPLYYAHHLKLNGTEVTNLVIPNDITEIKQYAFYGCTGLTEVTIGNSVTTIGKGAFNGCMLNTLIIMDGVNPIDMGGNTFGGSPLASIYIGRTMTNVTSPFKGITSLSKVTLGRGMTSLQSGAFAGCTGIKELVIEGGESAITIDCKFNDSPIEKLHIGRNGTYAFNNRVDLKDVSVGDNVTSLPNDAFNGCSNITSLKLGNKLETIGNGAFTGCATLMNVYSTNLTPPTGVVFDNKTYLQGTLYVVKGSKAAYEAADGWKEFWEIIDNLPFEVNGIWYNIDEYGNTKAVMNPSGDAYSGAISIPATIEYDGKVYPVTAIDAEAFANALNVKSITIEDSDQPLTIGTSATAIVAMSNDSTSVFGDCMLDSVYVGRNLSYQDAPFANISTLKKVTLGSKVTNMGGAMFAGCENIATVYAMGSTPATEAEFESKVYDHATLVVPVGTLNLYSTADGWKEFFTIQDVNGNVGVEDIVVDEVDNNATTIKVANGEIIVNGGADAQIAVYNINGGLVYQGMNRPVAVANKGVYIVVVNGVATKVVL